MMAATAAMPYDWPASIGRPAISTVPKLEGTNMIARFVPALALLSLSVGSPLRSQVPAGWRCWGECSRDTVVKYEGMASASVRSAASDSVGTFRQSVRPEDYLGKRVRFSAWVKTDNLAGPAALWMRVDGKGMASLQFDNMMDRPIPAFTDWKRYEVVLDVPKESTAIVFGLLLTGYGRAWLDDARLEAVDSSVQSTHIMVQQGSEADHGHPEPTAEQIADVLRRRAAAPRQPVNLNIEQRP
jgi:hypothetical protein